MQTAIKEVSTVNDASNRFPSISFRKKRLTVAIHAQFDLESSGQVSPVQTMIEDALSRLVSEGRAKVAYSVVDL